MKSMLTITGTVIPGSGMGKKLGLPPTINLDVSVVPHELRPGIYAVRVRCDSEKFDGVMHCGPRPAVNLPPSCEVHCFGLTKELYGMQVVIEVVDFIREIKDFRSIAELKVAIDVDIASAQKILFNI